MRKLFLTSIACNVLDKFVELLNCPPQDMHVAFIPTAADIYSDKSFVDNDRDKLLELGFQILDINITNETKESLEEKLRGVDIIFVAGGNTFYLLEKVITSGFDIIIKRMVEIGKYYVGSSAGSIIAGSSIESVITIDDPTKAPNLKSFDGLKLVDKIILPHYGNEKYKEKMDEILRNLSEHWNNIIKITDSQAIFINGESIKIISND